MKPMTTARSDFANCAAWLDFLYGDCDEDHGSIVIISHRRNQILDTFKVGSGDRLVAAARRMVESLGCYSKVNLMDAGAIHSRAAQTGRNCVGGRAEVKTVVSIHLDVDAGKSAKYPSRATALWALDNMPQKPTLVINSNGQQGGFHAYWKLAKPLRIDGDWKQVQAVANRWQRLLKERLGGRLDSTANLDRVLRCVGAPRLDGGRVEMELYEPNRLYELEQLGNGTE